MKGVYSMKRFFATLLALVMCLSLAPAALATGEETSDDFIAEGQLLEFDENGEAILEFSMPNDDAGITPYGGGVETWSGTKKVWHTVGSFNMEGNNLTPVKTINASNCGVGIKVTYSCSKPIEMIVQVRKAYKTDWVSLGHNDTISTSGTFATGECHTVSYGTKVQVFFKIYDADGNYDDNLRCYVSYKYMLVPSDISTEEFDRLMAS